MTFLIILKNNSLNFHLQASSASHYTYKSKKAALDTQPYKNKQNLQKQACKENFEATSHQDLLYPKQPKFNTKNSYFKVHRIQTPHKFLLQINVKLAAILIENNPHPNRFAILILLINLVLRENPDRFICFALNVKQFNFTLITNLLQIEALFLPFLRAIP